MANRTFQPVSSLDRATIHLYGSLTIGATGAITAQDSNGFTITRTGTGTYKCTLDDTYPVSTANYVSKGTNTSPLLNFDITTIDAGTRLFQQFTLLTDTVATNGQFTWVFDSAANTPQDPNSGAILRLMIVLKNSSTPRKGM